jgi:uncharacterized iron-regulated membrane protein
MKKIFIIHSYAGLITGIFLLLIGLTGSLLVFREEIDKKIYPSANYVKVGSSQISLDSMYRIIVHRYPKLDGIGITGIPEQPNESYEFRLYQNDGNIHTYDLYLVNIDPYTGQIVREGWYRNIAVGFMHWILQVHFSFQWGVPGLLLTAILALSMILSIVTGMIIYRKYIWSVISFKVRINTKNRYTFFSTTHRIIGVWALFFNLVIFFTGFWLNKFAFDPDIWKAKSIAAKQNTIIDKNIDTLINQTIQIQPMHHLYVAVPTRPHKKLIVYGEIVGQSSFFGKELNKVVTDVQSGKIVEMNNAKNASFTDRMESLVFPLHAGTFGGIYVKILYVLIGLTPGFLSLTGFLLWYRKSR